MSSPQQLPFLLRLFDDSSETVRQVVLTELAGWGEALPAALAALPEPPEPERIAAVLAAVERHVRPELAPARPRPRRRRGSAAVLFRVGQLVRHARYGYRGVVVSRDAQCRAPDSWYQANRSQPERDQPWYHVLVHDGEHVTYAAQSSLEPDPSADPVVHPLVPVFFEGLRDGSYVRNERPWPTLDG